MRKRRSKRHPWVWIAWAIVLLGLINGVVHRMTRAGLPPNRLYRDFYEFYSGSHAMLTGGDVYAAGKLGYIYPPLLGFLLMPISGLPIVYAAAIWLFIKVLTLVLVLVLCTKEILKRLGLSVPRHTAALIALVGTLFIFDKLRIEMNMQQSNLFVLLSFVLGLVWLDRKPILAGIALGFGANIKYITLITLPYLLIRGRFRAATSLVISTVAWALLPAIVLGWDRNNTLLKDALAGLVNLSNSSVHMDGVARIMPPTFGLSIPSFAARHIGGGKHTPLTVAFVLFIAVNSLLVAWLMYRGSGTNMFAGRWQQNEQTPDHSRAVLLEWCGLIVASLVFSPQTNSPHLSMMLLPCITAAGLLWMKQSRLSRGILWSGIIVMVAGLILPPGGIASDDLVNAWRSLSGQTWVLLPMFFSMLWVGLRVETDQSRNPIAKPAIRGIQCAPR